MAKYGEFRKVLHKLSFELVRSRKHETWVKRVPGEPLRIVRVSHQRSRDIPISLFKEMLRQAGINEEEFRRILKES